MNKTWYELGVVLDDATTKSIFRDDNRIVVEQLKQELNGVIKGDRFFVDKWDETGPVG